MAPEACFNVCLREPSEQGACQAILSRREGYGTEALGLSLACPMCEECSIANMPPQPDDDGTATRFHDYHTQDGQYKPQRPA